MIVLEENRNCKISIENMNHKIAEAILSFIRNWPVDKFVQSIDDYT